MKKNESRHTNGNPAELTTKECLLRPLFASSIAPTTYHFAGHNPIKGCLLPKQDVVGSNPITRSNSFKRGTCFPRKMSIDTLLSKYTLHARAEGYS